MLDRPIPSIRAASSTLTSSGGSNGPSGRRSYSATEIPESTRDLVIHADDGIGDRARMIANGDVYNRTLAAK
jgi:hypothetical protein